MNPFTLLTAALLTALHISPTTAIPTPVDLTPRQSPPFGVSVEFFGAETNGVAYSYVIPTNGQPFIIGIVHFIFFQSFSFPPSPFFLAATCS